jgi:hypothetical protein
MQQSLYMGSSTPTFHREASLSPQTPHTVSNFGNTSPTYQDQPNNTSSPSSGRVMHPSSAYNYGNPGYYYDPMQFPVSHETQTSPHSYTLHKDTYIPVPQTSPTVNVNTSDTPPSHFANFTTNPSVTLNTIPFGEYQSCHNPSIYVPEVIDDNDNILLSSKAQYYHNVNQDPFHYHPQTNFQNAGCQVSSSPPNSVTVFKGAKKLSLPYYDPSKITWTYFTLKLHVPSLNVT